MGRASHLLPIIDDYKKFRVSMYNPDVMLKHHNPQRNEYLVPQTVLDADVVINMPKLKTHKKAGLSCCLKNLVGINGNKNWLPHHRLGSPSTGGDQYERASPMKYFATRLAEHRETFDSVRVQRLLRFGQRVLLKISKTLSGDASFDGSWHGNDTVWRMVLDLNLLLFLADRDGFMTRQRQRRIFSIVDGIIAGEAEGPMAPDPKPIGVLTAGSNSLLMDTFHAGLMGFEYRRIPLIREAYRRKELTTYSPDEIRVIPTGKSEVAIDAFLQREQYDFVPPRGWSGRIERDPRQRVATEVPLDVAVDDES
jgi:hypothetical protein